MGGVGSVPRDTNISSILFELWEFFWRLKIPLQRVFFSLGVGGGDVGGVGRAGGAQSVSAFMHCRGCGFSSRSDADYLEARAWKEVQRQWSLYFPPDTKKNGSNCRGFWLRPLHVNTTEQPRQRFIHQRLQTKIR